MRFEYIRLPTHLGQIVVRDVAEGDLDALVTYWHGGVADLGFLGIDLEKLGTPEDTRARFRAAVRSDRAGQKTVAFVVAMDERVVGYSNVNFRGRDGYAHLHFIDPEARNRGVASFLMPFVLGMFFRHLPIDRLVLEARTRNARINRVIQKLGLRPAETLFLQQPDGLAGPGEFNVYLVSRSMVDDCVARILGTRQRAAGATESRGVEIRPFEERDAAATIQLWQGVFPDDPPWNDPSEIIRRKCNVQPELFLVAVVDGQLVGTVLAGFDGVRGWIHHLAVRPSSRRRGFATRLIRAAEDGLVRAGCPKVNLQVRATNTAVVALYRKLGYDVEDRMSMSKLLRSAG